MDQWIYFIHAPRERFAETMTDAEQAVWGELRGVQRGVPQGVTMTRCGASSSSPSVSTSASPSAYTLTSSPA